MISVKIVLPEKELETLVLFAERVADDLMQTAQEVFDTLQGPMLSDLERYPGKVKYPIEWTSERQRRAFFATNGFGAGIPYRRTGALARSWEVIGSAEDGKFIMVVQTSSPTARFVVGGLSEVIGPKTNFKQRFHTNTGWQDASETIRAYFDRYLDDLARVVREMR